MATLDEKARLELMGYLTSDMAFDFLRTKNTLGYVCFSMVPQVQDYYSFALIVRGTDLQLKMIIKKCASFMITFAPK